MSSPEAGGRSTEAQLTVTLMGGHEEAVLESSDVPVSVSTLKCYRPMGIFTRRGFPESQLKPRPRSIWEWALPWSLLHNRLSLASSLSGLLKTNTFYTQSQASHPTDRKGEKSATKQSSGSAA